MHKKGSAFYEKYKEKSESQRMKKFSVSNAFIFLFGFHWRLVTWAKMYMLNCVHTRKNRLLRFVKSVRFLLLPFLKITCNFFLYFQKSLTCLLLTVDMCYFTKFRKEVHLHLRRWSSQSCTRKTQQKAKVFMSCLAI